MELGTTGSILSFSLNLEEKVLSLLEEISSRDLPQGISQLLSEIQRNHQKRKRELTRLRRECVTEMILEPILDFSSEEYEIEFPETSSMSDSELLMFLKQVEETLRKFYNMASSKTEFLPEVSYPLETMSKKAERDRSSLERIG